MFERMRSGMPVLSRDGAHVGRIVDVTADGIVIEKGLIFHRDFLVPFSDIAQFRGEEIILSRDKASLRGARMPGEEASHAKGTTERTEARGDMAWSPEPPPVGASAVDDTETMTPAAAARPLVPARESPGVFPSSAPEPALHERRAAGPGWDPMSADEERAEPKPTPRTGPESDPLTRY